MNSIHTIDAGALARADWIEKRDVMLVVAAGLAEIDGQHALDESGAIVSDIARHRKELDAARRKITRDIDALKRSIMDQEKELAADLDDEQDRLRAMSREYLTEQDRIQREAEAAAEIKRRAEAEALIERDHQARDVFGVGVEIVAPVPDAAPEPPPAAVKPSTAGTSKRWKFELVDPALVPRCYLAIVDKIVRSSIKAMVDQGLEPQIDGLRIWSEIDIRARS